MLFLGDDWAEAHHDIELQDEQGNVLVRRRLPEGVAGLAQLHALIADHLGEDDEPASVVVGIVTDRGPWVQALIATGYLVYALNPLQVARYRERHVTSGAKSDSGDAHVLAEVVRTDRAHHRPVAGDSEQAAVIKTLARAHQSMIWMRQRQSNQLRSTLREFHPAALLAVGDDLAGRDAHAVLAIAFTPAAGRALSKSRIAAALKRTGRQRNIQARAEQIVDALRSLPPTNAGPVGRSLVVDPSVCRLRKVRGLERDGMVTRTVTPTVPVTVSYALTDLGHGLSAAVTVIRSWFYDNIDQIEAARTDYDTRNSDVAAPPCPPQLAVETPDHSGCSFTHRVRFT